MHLYREINSNLIYFQYIYIIEINFNKYDGLYIYIEIS